MYRYFCQECEGCAGSSICDHTTHPRVPLQFDISTHIAKTGHVAVSPITGFLSLAPITDLAYTHLHGADVRKQWKDLVLAGGLSYFLKIVLSLNVDICNSSILQGPTFPVSTKVLKDVSGQSATRYLKTRWKHSNTSEIFISSQSSPRPLLHNI